MTYWGDSVIIAKAVLDEKLTNSFRPGFTIPPSMPNLLYSRNDCDGYNVYDCNNHAR
jgi:hypothetical protein